jgi:hypothetical protein
MPAILGLLGEFETVTPPMLRAVAGDRFPHGPVRRVA